MHYTGSMRVESNFRVPVEELHEAPLNIINYVASTQNTVICVRTQRSEWTGYSNFFLFKVVLDDISKEGPSADYRHLGAFSTCLPSSVMCSPILHLNTLLGTIPLPTISHVLSNYTQSIFETFFLAQGVFIWRNREWQEHSEQRDSG